ncbi:MAG: DNA polymerase III subunit gamma and tau [Microbacteriaceae bacterium]|nr:DNA polymerase III subunit gamma and tau [Microbacteriaceae bacterium]
MVTALYRRYRPETFAELIGQSQVTDPLRTALRNDRVNHAYLFSGPRGCGKTTSARILARCLNCAAGPTDTPCGVCPSCVELSRDGSGSLDVVEIDAASHGGVEDSRDLRERAIFAPARDRYKIFILDEAHMVSTQGFNALLKLVEEPPEHVKFIFATTEPDKVISTIRSRTHHYPFRLVPPAQMLDYVGTLCTSESVDVEPGVLSLVVRAGGGSVRDTLSLLDQLIAGSDGSTVQYERAVALLGYTHATLLGEVVDALGAQDSRAAFAAVDRVIQTGQDPRRFVEDLLESLRDLIIVSAVINGPSGTSMAAVAAVLRGVQQEELDRMALQAAAFGAVELSRAADVANAALTEMTGATSPRLHLELMIARVLVPASDHSERGALARVERLERRAGVASVASVAGVSGAADASTSQALQVTAVAASAEISTVYATVPDSARSATAPATAPVAKHVAPVVSVVPPAPAAPTTTASTAPTTANTVPAAANSVSAQQLRDAWPEILEAVQKSKRSAWMVVFTSRVLDLVGDVLYLSFISENDVASFREQGAGDGVSEHLRRAIVEILGIRVKFLPRVDAAAHAKAHPNAVTMPQATAEIVPVASAVSPSAAAAPTTIWAAVSVPTVDPTLGRDPGTKPTKPLQLQPQPQPQPQPRASVASEKAQQHAQQQQQPSITAPELSYEPDSEADREPEPEFEPDPNPVFADAGQLTPRTATGTPRGTTSDAPVVAPNAATPNAATATTADGWATAPFVIAPRAAPPTVTPPTVTEVSVKPQFDKQRYGESVVREILGASFIEELAVVPRVVPRGD